MVTFPGRGATGKPHGLPALRRAESQGRDARGATTVPETGAARQRRRRRGYVKGSEGRKRARDAGRAPTIP